MELILMLLLPFPIGFFVRNRLAAFVTYIAAHSFVFTFQTMELLREWVRGSTDAFPAEVTDFDALPYGIVNLVIFGVGLGLVWLGHRLGSKRRKPRTVDLSA
ncbi:hypothetical protein Daura_20595 [Dactylosporangium aurantiacum]|uniref:Uncharacterized protein n=1 Tax=Dactylosporangium aurantiacum TaxID=35754 RepID=A0A9Q9ILI5_9ACTN|nr:hypothetical protein [Dactylosporangium aurantiacum]MDG6110265.1 hypothetical protein [Dactylosporangium aurantiacum]UWZ58364.1 hypothetical protein Daura_20595 [Dactylosporangium aurantiacum]